MILTHNQLALENSLRRILPAGVVSLWVPDGYNRAKDIIRGNHGQCYGTHPNVSVLPNLTYPSVGWVFGGDDKIVFGAPPSLNPGMGSWTVGGWAFARDYTHPKARFLIGDYTSVLSGVPCWGTGHGYSSTGIRVVFDDGVNRANAYITCDAGYKPGDTKHKWAYITIVFNRSTGKAYAFVNAVKQSSEVDISSVTGNVTNPGNNIGESAGYWLDGYCVLPFVAKGAWSQAQVTNFGNATKGLFFPRGF